MSRSLVPTGAGLGVVAINKPPKARLDEGHLWPTAFALSELPPGDEAKLAALVKKAVS